MKDIELGAPSAQRRRWLAVVAALGFACGAQAQVGQIKTSRGEVWVDRGAQTLPGRVGLMLETADTLRTGADGAVGVTMRDDSLVSAGPNSILSLARFEFDTVSSQGRFETHLRRGTLAVVTGRIAKQSPAAVTVRTPSAVLGARGTEFVVAVDE